MRALTYIAASSAALLSTVAEAGILFSDIRPKSYKKERKLDIHVGNLYSPYTIITHDMYYLNYCESNKGNYSYHDLNVEEDETDHCIKDICTVQQIQIFHRTLIRDLYRRELNVDFNKEIEQVEKRYFLVPLKLRNH